MTTTVSMAPRLGWRTPTVILLCGCLIGTLGFGARSGLGFFLTPMSQANGWGRDVFSLALAIQMLLWGAVQPFAGAIADRYGPVRVLSVGAVLYALGLATMAHADTPALLHLTAGVIIGFGLAGASFTIVIGAFGKLMPPSWRSFAFGAGTAAGSFGQFLFSPLAVALIDRFGWQDTLVIFGACVLLIIPLSLALATPSEARWPARPGRSAVGYAGALRGVRPPELCSACARLLHLRLPDFLHRGASARFPGRSRASRRSRRLGACDHRFVQHHRRESPPACSATGCRSATSWLSSISAARWRFLSTSCCRSPLSRPFWSVPYSACFGCRPCRRPRGSLP